MKLKKGLLWAVVLLSLPQFIYAQLVDASDVPPEIMQITTEGKLIVGLTASDQPPFYYTDKNGNLSGYDITLAKKLAANLGVEPEFNRDASNYNDIVALVVSGKIDIALTRLGMTLSRAKYVAFSEPYLELNHALLIDRKAWAKNTTEKDMSTYIKSYSGELGVLSRSIYYTAALKNFPNAQIVQYESWDEAVSDLLDGEISAIYRDSLEITRTQQAIPYGALYYKTIIFEDIPEQLSIAVKFDNSQLLNWINAFLKVNKTKITPEKLLDEYNNER